MGSSSGLIIAFVVVVWAAYFIPLALRRYDEASKNASFETTGALSRVISRPRAAAATAVAGAISSVATGSTSSTTTADTASVPESGARATPSPARSLDRPAARLAAQRRRRTLSTLLLLTVVVGAVAGFGVIALPWIAVPVALVVAWLIACRVQVRGERGISRSATAPSTGSRSKVALLKAPGRAVSLPKIGKLAKVAKVAKLPKMQRPASPAVAEEEDTIIVSGQFEDIDPGRKHVMESVPLEDDAMDDKIVIAVPSISTVGEALWDPLPVTLPTYVTKPRAGRTVRTIDFSQPHTWTSGHIEGQDVELPSGRDDTGEERRAVGH